MKHIFILMLLAFNNTAFSMNTADNLNYVITISENSSWKYCSKMICSVANKHGNGHCAKFPTIGIISANLTTYGYDLLMQNSRCEIILEEEQLVHGNPKLGTSN